MADLYFYNQDGAKVSITVDKLKTYAGLGIIKPDTIIENEKGQKTPAQELASRIKGLKFRGERQPPTVPSAEPNPLTAASPEQKTTTTWYYYASGQKHGPITGGQLKGLAKTGIITPETAVETEDGKTVPARKIKGLTFIEPAQKTASRSPVDSHVVPPTTGAIYGVKPHGHDPFTATIPEMVESPSVVSQVAKEPSADNPFTPSLPTIPEPVEANPFSAPVPAVVGESIKNITENFGEEKFEQLLQDDIEQFQKQERVEDQNPFSAVQLLKLMKPHLDSVPASRRDSSGSSWQVTIIGLALILVVGGLGWQLISTFTPNQTDNAQTVANEPVQVEVTAQEPPVAQPSAPPVAPSVVERAKPDPPKNDPRLEQLVIKNWKVYVERVSFYTDINFDVIVQNNTGKAIESFYLRVNAKVTGRTVPPLDDTVLFRPRLGSIEPGETVTLTGDLFNSPMEKTAIANWKDLEWSPVKIDSITFHDDEKIRRSQ